MANCQVPLPRIQIIAVPESTQGEPLMDHVHDSSVIARASNGREAVLPLLEHPHLLRLQGIDQIGLMGGGEELRAGLTGTGVLSELVRQGLQQLVVKPVFRFLDTDERGWGQVFEQQQIGKDLEGTLRHLLGIKGV